MSPHKIASASFVIIGIITFLTGMLRRHGVEAYEKQSRVKRSFSPTVREIKLMGIGSMWIIAGILLLFNII